MYPGSKRARSERRDKTGHLSRGWDTAERGAEVEVFSRVLWN